MKILVLNFEYPPLGGGASPVCKRICLEMVQRNHKVSVLTMGLVGLASEEVEEGVRIFRLDVGRKLANMSYPLEHLRFLRKGRSFLNKHLKVEKYDAVHCHFIISSGILASWVKRRFGIRYIVTAHGSDLPNYNPDRFKLIHLVTPYVVRKVLQNCHFATAPSNFLASVMKPYLRVGKNVVVIPNGIDIPEIDLVPKKKIILSTGRLLKRKGFQNLVEAVKDIESDYELHICGDGPEMGNLQAIAKGSKTKITFHGWIDNTSSIYIGLLRDAEIFSMVSELENASVSILEAMSNACAVITSDQSGTAEMVASSGILLPPYDTESLRKALLDLIQDSSRIRTLGLKAYQRAKELYTWKKIGDDYEHLLLETSNVMLADG